VPGVLEDLKLIVVREYLFRFNLTDPMFVITLLFIALVPLKTDNMFKVNHPTICFAHGSSCVVIMKLYMSAVYVRAGG